MAHLAVAGLQLDLKAGDNLDRIADEVAAVKRRFPWIDLVLLGELSAFGVRVDAAQPMPGPAEARFSQIARDNRVWLVPGSIYERSGERVFNTAPVIDPAGQVIARCRKLYPFLPYERGVAAGEAPVVFDMPGVGRIGVSICYDMWFPETTRALALLGAEVVLHPTLTNTIDRETEKAIARASCGSSTSTSPATWASAAPAPTARAARSPTRPGPGARSSPSTWTWATSAACASAAGTAWARR